MTTKCTNQRDITNDYKQCCTCKSLLTSSDFYKDASRSDGLDTICKECRKTVCHRHYKKSSESIKQQQYHYRRSSNGKEALKRSTGKYYEKYSKFYNLCGSIRYMLRQRNAFDKTVWKTTWMPFLAKYKDVAINKLRMDSKQWTIYCEYSDGYNYTDNMPMPCLSLHLNK